MSVANSVSTVTQSVPTIAPPSPPSPPPGLPMDPEAFYQMRELSSSPGVQMTAQMFDWLGSLIGAMAAVLVTLLLTRLIQSFMLHRSINKSIEANSAHASALIDKVNKPLELALNAGPRDAPGDDRNGLVLVAIGLAMAGFGLIQGDEATIRIAAGAALFPLLVGIALLVRRRLLKAEIEQERSAERG